MPLTSLSIPLVDAICVKYPHLQTLNLSHNELVVLQHLEKLPFLQHLNASHNQLHTVSLLSSSFNRLITLNLSYNCISNINSWILEIGPLINLNVSFNAIEHWTDIENLKHMSTLQHLNLRGNGVCQSKEYRKKCIYQLKSILDLDEREITAEERMLATLLFENRLGNRRPMEVAPTDLGQYRALSGPQSFPRFTPHEGQPIRSPVSTEQQPAMNGLQRTSPKMSREELERESLKARVLELQDLQSEEKQPIARQDNSRHEEQLLRNQVNALENIVQLQENAISKNAGKNNGDGAETGRGEEYSLLLSMWRKKVFELLLQMQRNEIVGSSEKRSVLKEMHQLQTQLERQQSLCAISTEKIGHLSASCELLQSSKKELIAEKQKSLARAASMFTQLDAQKNALQKLAHFALSHFQSRESVEQLNNIAHATRRLGAFQQRIALATERLHLLSALLTKRFVHLRNSEAALEGERRVWIRRLQKAESGKEKELVVVKPRELETSITTSCTRGLHPDCEEAIRDCFYTMDYYHIGLINKYKFISQLQEDINLGDIMAKKHPRSRERWVNTLAQLKNRCHPSKKVTWGEFLLEFIPGVKMEMPLEDPTTLPPSLDIVFLQKGTTIPILTTDVPISLSMLNELTPKELCQEVLRLTQERKELCRRITSDASQFTKMALSVRSEWEEKVHELVGSVAEHKEKWSQSLTQNAMLQSEMEAKESLLQKEVETTILLTTKIDDLDASNSLKMENITYVHEKEMQILREEHVCKIDDIMAENAALKIDNSKSVLSVRLLERQLTRGQEKASEMSSAKMEYVEEKLKKRDAEISKLRRERNTLLSTLREQEKQNAIKNESFSASRLGFSQSFNSKREKLHDVSKNHDVNEASDETNIKMSSTENMGENVLFQSSAASSSVSSGKDTIKSRLNALEDLTKSLLSDE